MELMDHLFDDLFLSDLCNYKILVLKLEDKDLKMISYHSANDMVLDFYNKNT